MSVRPMKFHIYNHDLEPLCWEENFWDCDKAIEFDSNAEAVEFLILIAIHYPLIYEELWGIKEDILYYDGGYIHGALAMELMKKELKEERGLDF